MNRSCALLMAGWAALSVQSAYAACPAWINHTLPKLHSTQKLDLCAETADKVVLITNTASHCGFTNQFGSLEKLHKRYKEYGLVIIGFPSNDFHQEADNSAETASVCYKNYGVTFLMTSQQVVTGDNAHPIFRHLARQTRSPSWNFNKYLVDRKGEVTGWYASNVHPQSGQLVDKIESLLKIDPEGE